jgi:hypothetical protein
VVRSEKKQVQVQAASSVGENTSTGADARIDKLVADAIAASDARDSAIAQRALEQARALCIKSRSLSCLKHGYDIYFRLGQLYEGQLRWVDAIKEYARLQERSLAAMLSPAQRTNVAASVAQIEPRVGRVIIPKELGGRCQEVSVWMPPGSHLVVVRGESQQVEVRAGQEVKVGACR